MLTFVRSLKVAHPAHELLVLEVHVVQVKAEIAFRESLKVQKMLLVNFWLVMVIHQYTVKCFYPSKRLHETCASILRESNIVIHAGFYE